MPYRRRANASKDLIRLLEYRLAFGPVYAVGGVRNRTALIVVPLTGPKNLSWRYTYSAMTLEAVSASGALIMTPIEAIPGGWSEQRLRTLGEPLRFWEITLPFKPEEKPDDGTAAARP